MNLNPVPASIAQEDVIAAINEQMVDAGLSALSDDLALRLARAAYAVLPRSDSFNAGVEISRPYRSLVKIGEFVDRLYDEERTPNATLDKIRDVVVAALREAGADVDEGVYFEPKTNVRICQSGEEVCDFLTKGDCDCPRKSVSTTTDDRAAAIRNLKRTEEEDGWRPIDEDARPGRVLAWSPNATSAYVAFWREHPLAPDDERQCGWMTLSGFTARSVYGQDPTHYQPLPSPPKRTEEES